MEHLPDHPIPDLHPDNYVFKTEPLEDGHQLVTYADSDWAGDSTHQKLITGILVMYAGGIIGYKTKYQDIIGYKTKYQGIIAHSSMEAEFVTVHNAGKHDFLFLISYGRT